MTRLEPWTPWSSSLRTHRLCVRDLVLSGIQATLCKLFPPNPEEDEMASLHDEEITTRGRAALRSEMPGDEDQDDQDTDTDADDADSTDVDTDTTDPS